MTDKKRRQFVTFMGAGSVAIPVTALVGSRLAYAEDLPMVDEASDAAKNWEYVAVTATDGQNCMGCALYQGAADSEAGPCALFPGSHVAAEGWCKAFAPKPS